MYKCKNRYTIYLPIFFSLVLIIGIILGAKLTQISSNNNDIFSINLNRYDKINDVLNYIVQEYVDSVNKNNLSEDAIKGMLLSLDPHSQYISAEEFDEINDPLMGNFEGIGIQFRIEKTLLL